tara:strand:- start:1664 stop:2107 length:444 start_codon:yes stop_codon:yes gene_type:complete
MYSFILIFHIVLSVLLVILTFYTVVRAILGIFNKVKFSKFFDLSIPIVSVIFLYLELILGLILYAIHINRLEILITPENASSYFSARFWAVEHAILMFFAIVFGHLGLVYAKNLENDQEKFKKILMYFSTCFLLIIFSVGMNMFKNG